MSKEDGGPAFPRLQASYDAGATMLYEQIGGMTLRDYFAIHSPNPDNQSVATQRGIDRGRNPYNDSHKPPLRDEDEIRAYLRYRYADAMLKERAK